MSTISDKLLQLNSIKEDTFAATKECGLDTSGHTFSNIHELWSQIKKANYQTKNAIPSDVAVEVVADEGYDALAKVIVDAALNVQPWNIPEGITMFGVTGTMKVEAGTEWPDELPATEEEMDEAVTEDDADAPTEDKMVLVDNEGNITTGYLYTAEPVGGGTDATQEELARLGVAATTAAINGTTATTLFTGMGTSAATGSVIGLMDTYAVTTGVAASGTALASTIGAGTVITAAGSLVVGAAAALALIGFIEWLKEDKGIVAGGDSVSLYSSYGFLLADGSIINVGLVDDAMYRGENPGSTVLYEGITYEFSSGYQCYVKSPYFYHKKVGRTSFEKCGFDHFTTGEFVFVKNASSTSVYFMPLNGGSITASGGSTNTSIIGSSVSPDLSLVPIEEIQELPDVIPDGQTMVISPGITALPQNDPQAAADAIMQTAIDGSFNPVITIEPYYGGGFTITHYDPVTTEFRAVGWRRVSKHTTGELAGQITKDDFTRVESGGWNYLKNIRSCTREKLYYKGVEVWPECKYQWQTVYESTVTTSTDENADHPFAVVAYDNNVTFFAEGDTVRLTVNGESAEFMVCRFMLTDYVGNIWLSVGDFDGVEDTGYNYFFGTEQKLGVKQTTFTSRYPGTYSVKIEKVVTA